mmetsp:Transcript_17892/g.30448  ORF Transcript_17892/g.30448 Transcript_17892/m.30448 type:complete len:327 (-) Transcript_17892:353-1333(-)
MTRVMRRKQPSRMKPMLLAAACFAFGAIMYISRPQDDQMVESVENILRGSTFLAQESSWLWEEMNDKERSDALTRVVPYLKSFVRVLNQTKIDGWRSQERCQVEKFGTKWGIHQLCEQSPPPTDCVFLSFGIHRDYSFDVDLAKRWNCRGFAADPTVDHKSHLHSLVTFHNIAAKVLHPNQEQSEAKDPWWIASVPATKKFLGISRIHVLKMDCEGCEYSLPRDILAEDPSFFHSVDQFTFEVHLNKLWLDDMESFYYFAMLFKLLHEAGLELMGSSIGGCGWDKEETESFQPLVDVGFPGQGVPKLYRRRSCHEYLFARVPNKGQ